MDETKKSTMNVYFVQFFLFAFLFESTPLVKAVVVTTEYDDFPYFANFYDCGGALIAEDIVLTAAHCLNAAKGGNQVTFNKAEERFCTEWVNHPDYDEFELYNDYALCKLDKPVVINENKVRIKLNNEDSIPFDDEDLFTMGLGYSDSNYTSPFSLQEISASVMSTEYCKTIPNPIVDDDDGFVYSTVTENMICANSVPDLCQGDAGGPLIRRTDQGDGTFVDTHVGLSSWRRYDGQPCGFTAEGASVFARTSTRLDWIKETSCSLGSQASWCSSLPPSSCNGPKLILSLALPEGVTFDSNDPTAEWSLLDKDQEDLKIVDSSLKRLVANKNYYYEHTVCLDFDTDYKWEIKLPTPLEYSLNLDGTMLVSGNESGTRKFSIPSCSNNLNPFFSKSGNEFTCSEIAELNQGRGNQCQKSSVAKNCSGLCNEEQCACANYQAPFKWKGIKTITCEEVAEWSESKRKKNCKRKKIGKNCRGLCDAQCNAV